MKTLRLRLAVSLIVLLVVLAYALPNIPSVGNSFLGAFMQDRINLGLDLKGGMNLTLGVDVEKAIQNTLTVTGQDISDRAKQEKLTLMKPRLNGEGQLEVTLPRADQAGSFEAMMHKWFPNLQQSGAETSASGRVYTFELSPEARKQTEDMTMEQVVRTIRNRIDQFGVAEPDIRKQADFRIQIQLPGLTDSKRAIQLVGQTAQLTFHLVRDDVNPQGILPPGVALFPMVTVRPDGSTSESMIALDKEPLMTGEDVADDCPTFDNRDNKPSVGLSFNSRGAAMFERITGEHIHKRMAIVLDGKVHSAPTIQSRIGGGKASITGSFTPTEAQDLAIVLRAGSLPAPVTVLEERTVGPSLGKESIESGILAAAVGGIAVMVVMPLYYGLAGLLADVMLVFTITMLMAGLAVFGATLTLPGIAGIVLTIGMSVDANVLIFERIREEIRQGLKPLEAVAVGFDRATISIVDSNLTTIIAAAILYQFGTGPVRGFAVTLSLGIVASMFTAIFVSRTAFGLWLGGNDGKKLSI